MTYIQPSLNSDLDSLQNLPGWVSSIRAETSEDMAFLSGGALAALHVVLTRATVPHALLRERLALRAAESCLALAGRPERTAAMRDEVHMLRPGDQPGPAGAVFQQWRRSVARPISVATLKRALPETFANHLPGWLRGGRGGPVARAAQVLQTVLTECPGEDTVALILADTALARAVGWDHALPLLAAGLTGRDLRQTGADLRLACHRSIVTSANQAATTTSDLARRTAKLKAVTPKLRAKAAGPAVQMFLTQDALSPSVALSGIMSDRAARRLCDRLVDLGAVRELTGRDTFRLYGV